jgi:Phosphodiester glycosidase
MSLTWERWTTVSQGGAPPGSLVTAVPFGQRFAVFITDPNGGIYTTGGTPGTPFGPWALVGDPFRAKPGSPVTAVPWGDRFALFVTDKNGEIFTTAGDPQRGFPGGWTTVSQGSAPPGSLVTAVPFGQRFAVFITDPNGGIYTTLGGALVMPPHIGSTIVYGPDGNVIAPINGQVPLTIGVRYTVGVKIRRGTFATYTAGVEVNPSLPVPTSLNVLNRVGATGHVLVTEEQTRKFAFTPSQPGSFPVGFQLRDKTGAFSADGGIRVSCSAESMGLYGRVTSRLTDAPIAGASITTNDLSAVSASDGSWHLPTANGGPLRATISKNGHSSTVAVNVSVPSSSGVRIDTPLEDSFSALKLAGLDYTTYIDYSRGRTILHTVRINPLSSSGIVSLAQASDLSAGVNLHDTATALNSLVIINGGYFDTSGRSQGYLYTNGFANPEVLPSPGEIFAQPGPPNVVEPANVLPMLTIAGASVRQRIDIVHSESDFMSTNSSQWHRDSDGHPIWSVSDVSYALQAAPTLLMNGSVTWRGEFDVGSGYQQYFPRTAVGVGPGAGGNTLYVVVADGEGVNGGNGATFNQLGEFFRDVLGATAAMNLDGGESTEMVLQGASEQRTMNVLTSENNAAPDGYLPSGVVKNYLKIGV